MDNGYYSREELESFNFYELGSNVFISRKASIYGAKNMKIGSNIRIDDFCLLVGTICLGDYIHIAAYTGLHASMGSITLGSFSTLSSRVAVYAASDDYSGNYLTNSMIPENYKNIQYGDIFIGKHVIVGTGCTILHKARIEDGVAIGAMAFVNAQLPSWQIYAGIPCRRIRERDKNALLLEKEFLSDIQSTKEV